MPFVKFRNWLDEFIDMNGSNVIIISGELNIHYNQDIYDKNTIKALIENNGMK